MLLFYARYAKKELYSKEKALTVVRNGDRAAISV